jgi:hypothetical protein
VIDLAQIDAIKAECFSQAQFLGELVDGATRWEIESGELRLFYPAERRALGDLLQSRDRIEKLRTSASRVLGQPLRVCVKLDSSPAPTNSRPRVEQRPGVEQREDGRELRARFEQDPTVRAMLDRFGGRITEVKRNAGTKDE